MTKKTICVLPGDGCGPEVIAEAVKVLKTILKHKKDLEIALDYHDFGGCAIDAFGTPLPDATLAAAKDADAILLGAVGGPKWGFGKVRPEQGLLAIRKALDVYANLRPCNFASESLLKFSPLRPEIAEGTNFVVLRELVGGIYFGDRKEDDGSGYAYDTMPYSRAEIERVTRLAAALASATDPPLKITSLDKANVLATSRLWRKTVTEVLSKEYPNIAVEHQLIDSAAMVMVKDPRSLNGVVMTENLFGDIITDEASVIPGSLGLLPSASLAAIPGSTKGKVNGIYEPCHGSAPDIAGKGIVNPVATILSVAMMFRYSFQREDVATAIEKAVRISLDESAQGGKNVRTKDIGGSASTTEMGDTVCSVLETMLN